MHIFFGLLRASSTPTRMLVSPDTTTASQTYSIFTWSSSLRSTRACRMSASRLCSMVESTWTERLTARLSSSPERSFDRILTPTMFQLSGGTVPVSLRVAFWGACRGCCPPGGAGAGSGMGGGWSTGSISGGFETSGGALACSALSLVIRKVLESNVTSSAETASRHHTLANCPVVVLPAPSPKSPFSTNSRIFSRSTRSGSNSLVREPLRKLCRRLLSGHVPLSFRAGGQFLSMYPAPTDSFSNAFELRAATTRSVRVLPALVYPAPRSMVFRPFSA